MPKQTPLRRICQSDTLCHSEKKPGRPRKNQVETEAKPAEETTEKPETVPSAQEEKPAAQPEAEKRPISKPILKPKPAVVDEESSILSDIDADDDFIPIEDLPSEKVELPTELFGKFESTKAEAATAPNLWHNPNARV